MEMKTLTLNGQKFTVDDPDSVSVEQFQCAVDELVESHGVLSTQYDLKGGYGYTADVYISEDGVETALTGQNYKCIDYIPVKAGESYTMYGIGYALYDENKAFLSAVIDSSGANSISEFTPVVNGYVRLTINSPDIFYARFCRTADKFKELRDYEEEKSPFFDVAIPCDVHLYGDSNSEGYGLENTSKAWSNLLGALITTRLPSPLYFIRMACFADKEAGNLNPFLKTGGYARLTAFTDQFGLRCLGVGQIDVIIDGQLIESVVADPTSTAAVVKTYAVDEGLHTIELFGVSGENEISYVCVNRRYQFTNHAVSGYRSDNLPDTPEGSIAIVMMGTNDRGMPAGWTYAYLGKFYNACKTAGVIPFIFTPIPTATYANDDSFYKQSMGATMAQLPPGCINIYKDLQMIEILTGETMFCDNLHLNERGHKLLYAIAASKLQLAALNSELTEE